MSEARRLPVGIPLEAPPGWKPRPSLAWRNASIAAVLTTLALTCLAIGWISVDPGSGRPRRSLPSLASLLPSRSTPEPEPDTHSPAPEEKPVPVEKPPEPKVPEKQTPEKKTPEKKTPEKKDPEKKGPEKKGPEKPPEKTPSPMVVGLSFKKDVAPILEKACVRCHNANKQQGDVNISTYEDVLKHVMAGKPDASDVLNVIVNGQMPPNAPNAVSDAEKKKLHDWILQGAKP
jgi:hypothetical protein